MTRGTTTATSSISPIAAEITTKMTQRAGCRRPASTGSRTSSIPTRPAAEQRLDGVLSGRRERRTSQYNTVLELYGEDSVDDGCRRTVSSGLTRVALRRERRGPGRSSHRAAVHGKPGMARVNKPVLFRRALKLDQRRHHQRRRRTCRRPGLTIAAENPVYVQGNYNATTAARTPSPTCRRQSSRMP